MILLPQKKTYSICVLRVQPEFICGCQLVFSKSFAQNLQIYFVFFPINLKMKHLLARIGVVFWDKKLNF